MTWLQKVQTKSYHEKVRLIWMTVGIVFVFLVIFWIIVGNYRYANTKKDMRLFETLDQGIKEFKEKAN